jgi:hypothetical protein
MIIAAAKMSFKRLSMFTLLSLCVSGIVARKLSACIYGSARQNFLYAGRPLRAERRTMEAHRAVLPTDVRGVERVDDRRVICGIVQVLKSGCRWRDCPA